ncbi:glycosyltransferase family 4 protein [Thalassospira sp.]|uniref:glycosyltransferase family 4 protein n=1 Tax=Thalassospira sp. TaxID=1912094 RepID=UPI000C377640|nr:glycosyltransferase family 4 protein [Thalassospira sp.]MAL38632.1 hypothetical protein [Thalassospira sp.]HAY47512.1 hypothetical protein [Thalassospira sp.]|tara:strand:+ start:935 stop:1969 length:1035 start_codon:yes stop_codon:yes gene_type:complete
MATIVLADDGIKFDGFTLAERPLGGAETAFISLAEGLAARGHDVTIVNNCDQVHENNGVKWQPLSNGFPATADLYIANRGHRLLDKMPEAKRTIFWIHNPAGYLLKWRYLSRLWKIKPAIVFSGAHHLATYPRWAPCGERIVIPYGIENRFMTADVNDAIRAKRAIFTSNPLRSLDWLVDLWAEKIHPLSPDAELHVFAGPQTYGAAGDEKALRMKAILDHAETLRDKGIVLRGPVPKSQLLDEMREARVMPYRGDVGETFCLALGEAQAMGVPCVVQEVGCVAERIRDGKTGFVANDDDLFAKRTAEILNDDVLWAAQHKASLEQQRSWGWAQAAEAFEKLIK